MFDKLQKSTKASILAFSLIASMLTGCASQQVTWDNAGNKMVVDKYEGMAGTQETIRKELPGGYTFYSRKCSSLAGQKDETIIIDPEGYVVPAYTDDNGVVWKSNIDNTGRCGPGDAGVDRLGGLPGQGPRWRTLRHAPRRGGYEYVPLFRLGR